MSLRHLSRKFALQILYQFSLNHKITPQGEDLLESLRLHFEYFAVPTETQEFIRQLVMGTLIQQQNIDAKIDTSGSPWKISRMSTVDRCLIRQAVFEMIFHTPPTEKAVVINETVELAKTFGTADSPSFINGILDSIKN